jgi:PqqD family protein of HPr-rel-A system
VTPAASALFAATWCPVRPAVLLLRRWDDQTVVYDPLPGSTHLLDPVASAVFDCLLDRGASAQGIAKLLAPDFDADAEEDVLEAVLGALAKLRAADLIHPAAP